MKKILNKIKEILIENKTFIIVLIVLTLILNIPLPYYVMTPGGLLDTSEKIEIDGKSLNGSYNMLYVSEYRGTVLSLVLAAIFDEWDVESIKESQISNESTEEIDLRNKEMLQNSLQNAIFLAYNELDLEVEITDTRNIVVGILEDAKTDLKIGDVILSHNEEEMESLDTYRKLVKESDVQEKINLKVLRNGEETNCYATVYYKDGQKLTGLSIITNYDYMTNPLVNFNFDESESGSSGGLMLALSIYDLLSEEDLLRGRKIAGTGAILENGEVEEISGIKYKIIGASLNDVDIVFVPTANYQEALEVKEKYNLTLEIIAVETFYDALLYLKKG